MLHWFRRDRLACLGLNLNLSGEPMYMMINGRGRYYRPPLSETLGQYKPSHRRSPLFKVF